MLGGAVASLRRAAATSLQHVRHLSSRKRTILRLAKGYYGRSKNCWTIARRRVEKALQYAYISRRLKKRACAPVVRERRSAARRKLMRARAFFPPCAP